jgi:4-carboxymuconolactone decarboxylase
MNLKQSDTEFYNIMENFINEVSNKSELLSNKQKELIKIVSLITQQSKELLLYEIENALSLELTPIEIKEAIYQCAPYSGFPRTIDAINIVNKVFEKNNIHLPLEKQSTVTKQTIFEKGLTAQTTIFGEAMREIANGENTPNPAYYLITNCFGDYYTRNGLDLKTREMLTLCILINLGTESQIKSHINGNVNMGNNKAFIQEMIYQCLPYCGYPRTLNALNCLNEVLQ